jgi:uncharacterized protein
MREPKRLRKRSQCLTLTVKPENTMNSEATASGPHDERPYELTDEEFDALEELLTSDAVPEDCMNLEMLDGYLAAVIASPRAVAPEDWMPGVWTAHGDEVAFASGRRMQKVIRLVRAYYNELVFTICDPEGWEPFWYASADDGVRVGEEWIEGFAQGLELWPDDWENGLPETEAEAVRATLDALMAPWEDGSVLQIDEESRLQWLEQARAAVCSIVSRWQALALPPARPIEIEEAATVRSAGPGRNDPCPCGSGKKFKKCCGSASVA